jgi:hypothetical protein
MIFEDNSGILGFFLVLWKKFAEFCHHGSTGKIGILESV